jgi:hypothetical protein
MPLTNYTPRDAPEISEVLQKFLPVVRSFLAGAKGKANAIKSPVIEKRFSLAGPQVRAIIHELRLTLEPICSGGCGYYYAETQVEYEEYLISIKERWHSLNELLEAGNNVNVAAYWTTEKKGEAVGIQLSLA